LPYIGTNYSIAPLIKNFKGILTPNIKDNLKKLQQTIIAPIAEHYDAKESGINIIRALSTKPEAIAAGGTSESPFAKGKAVEISMDGVSSEKLYNDIRTKKLELDFGTLVKKQDSVEISLPDDNFKNNAIETETTDEDTVKVKMFDNNEEISF